MKLSIDLNNLKLLLEEKKEYIGRKVSIIGLIEAIMLAISAITEPYSNPLVPANVIKVIVFIIAALQIYIFVKELCKPKYEKDDLLNDIIDLNIQSRSSSIIAIKNSDHPTKYLLYYDVGWDFWQFPNYATVSENEHNIIRKLTEQLRVDSSAIALSRRAEGQELKYSTEHNEDREYHYTIYSASIENFAYYKDDEFRLEGRKYKWMTIDEMLTNKKLNENNHYIIGLVRDNT